MNACRKSRSEWPPSNLITIIIITIIIIIESDIHLAILLIGIETGQNAMDSVAILHFKYIPSNRTKSFWPGGKFNI